MVKEATYKCDVYLSGKYFPATEPKWTDFDPPEPERVENFKVMLGKWSKELGTLETIDITRFVPCSDLADLADEFCRQCRLELIEGRDHDDTK